MTINDRNRSRRTYSFFRAQPADPAVTILSGGAGVEITGDRNQIVISVDAGELTDSDWTVDGSLLYSTSSIGFGALADIASQGTARVGTDWSLVARNGSDDISMLWMTSGSNNFSIGGSYGTVNRPTNINIHADSEIRLSINGSQKAKITSTGLFVGDNQVLPYDLTLPISSSYTSSIGELVRLDPGGGAFELLLPSAAGLGGLGVTMKNVTTSSNAVTFNTDGSETIDGELSGTIEASHGTVTVISDDTNWMRFPPS